MSSIRITHELQNLQNGQQVSWAQERLMRHFLPWLEEKLRTQFGNQTRLDVDCAAASALRHGLERVEEECRFHIRPREQRQSGSPGGDFCKLLWAIAKRKSLKQLKAANAVKRKPEVREGDLAEPGTGEEGEDQGLLAQVAGGELAPDVVVAGLEECDRLLRKLPEALRPVALLRLEGWSNEQISKKFRVALKTVEHWFKQIRSIWEREASHE